MARIEFWYDFASTYAYLTAMRIEAIAARHGVDVAWRPFLLGPIFKAQGWDTSPFNLYPAKGRYMVRDIERIAEARGVAFRLPAPFPQNGLMAARMAVAGADATWVGAFSKAVFKAQFEDGASIADRATLVRLACDLGLDGEQLAADGESAETKQQLRARTEAATGLGIFGAPTFVTPDRELFWGDDRLEFALDWMAR